MAKRWYVVHAYSGYEKHVMRSLIERVKLAGMEDEFGEILVPTEEVVEMRNGQKRKSERKFFPGYVLVQMEMNEATWHDDDGAGRIVFPWPWCQAANTRVGQHDERYA